MFDDTITVLHVDDGPDFVDRVATFLERETEHIEVRTAVSPSDGLRILSDSPVDCIVSGYEMSPTNGIEFLEAVREDYPDLPFILYTGDGSEAVAAEAIEQDVTSYLQNERGTEKLTVLQDRIETHVDQYRATRHVDRRKRESRRGGNASIDAFWVLDPATDEIRMEGLDSFGYETYEQTREWWVERLHPSDRERVRANNETLLTDTEDAVDAETDQGWFTTEYRLRRADGTYADCLERGITVFEDGTPEKIVGTVTESTDEKQREQRLERSQIFIQTSPDIFTHIDTDGTIAHVTETEHILGRARTEFLENPLEEFLHPADTDRALDDFADLLSGTEQKRTEVRLKHGDGSWIWIEAVGSPIPRQYDLDGVVTIIREITERKERERELERTHDFFTEAERLGNLGAWEFDETGNAVWTDGTRRIHDVDDEFQPTVDEGLAFFHPDDRERIERAVETALETGESFDMEARLITADGAQRWVRTRGKVPSDETPRTVRGYMQDITARKERERELRSAHTQLENAIEAGAVGTWEWHIPDDQMVVGREFARRFGVDPELGQDGVELERFITSIHEADRDRVEQEIEAAMEACGEYEAEYRVWDAADELHWVLARGHVECNEHGDPVRFPGVLVDLTERKQMEQELQRQNERLNEFASVLSHDLRNPLNVAKARLELADEDCDSEHLGHVDRALDRMEALIDDLLLLARGGDTNFTPVELAAIADSCWTTVQTDTATLVIETDHKILADEGRLKQVFENLIRNSVEHGSTSGQMEPNDSDEESGEDVTVTIGGLSEGFYFEDDGPGIPPSERDDVFKTGYSTSREGTGFGLSIVEQIVEAHDWTIRVTEGTDGGARFEITGVEFADWHD